MTSDPTTSKFHTIIAGCDGRERGRSAVSLANAIAEATGARLLVVRVHFDPHGEAHADTRRGLELELRAVRDELAPRAAVELVRDSSPARGLRRVAQARDADLLVVGSRHRRRSQQILDADHAMQVLHGAGCCVAIAPDPIPPSRGLWRIGVGIDDTEESLHALRIARDLAVRAGAHLSLLAVAETVLPWWMGLAAVPETGDLISEMPDRREARARELLAERAALCQEVPVDASALVGEPAGELSLAGRSLDLLVLGSRRWGPVRRLVLGSTSERVIRHAECPILVPPRGIASAAQETETLAEPATLP